MANEEKKKFKFRVTVRGVLMVLTAILVGIVIYQNWPDMIQAFHDLRKANAFVLLLLIPEQLVMYYSCGQIFFSYLKTQKDVKKFTNREILRISTELNFVNHAVPAGGVGGLAYLTFRLKPYNVTAGQASFLYLFRYAVTTVFNYLQALIAIVVLLIFNKIPGEAMWIIPVALLMNMGVGFMLWLVLFVASSSKRIDKFAKLIVKLESRLIRIVTFGHKKRVISDEKIRSYFTDIHASVVIMKQNKKNLKKPALWGIAYSLFEVGTYYLVGISLGRWELLPYIMVGEAIGSVFDGIVPYGLYELGMAGVMVALGVDAATAAIVTVMTRVFTLLFTVMSGVVPYYQALSGRKLSDDAERNDDYEEDTESKFEESKKRRSGPKEPE
ncbi:flippase-like domain-containing protein [Candidatus Saccharibacteria bacterium]|nr:flippase-like domain-containing protein [Candidatus Saccharibacteria bacterium]